jgi:GNAT superfamily N-acetyltransferase
MTDDAPGGGPRLDLTDAPHPDEQAVVYEGLAAYNETKAGRRDARPLAIFVRDPSTSAVIGGLVGRTSLGMLTVDRFFLPEGLRGQDLGTRILAMAETEGKRRGCTRAMLMTMHFQAPGFYQKQGWEIAYRFDPDPPGHTRFCMTKKLA